MLVENTAYLIQFLREFFEFMLSVLVLRET